MVKKLVFPLLAIALVAAISAGYFKTRTKVLQTCEKVLSNEPENRFCVSTTEGVLVFELYKDATPKAIEHLQKLSNTEKFYDDLVFYRVSKDFVAQTGIQDQKAKYQTAKPEESQIQHKLDLYDNDKFDTEANFDKLNLSKEDKESLDQDKAVSTPNLNSRVFEYGSISFANAGPGTNSTELFVVTSKDKDSSNVKYLNGRFSNMGKIIKGTDVLDKINSYGIEQANSTGSDIPTTIVKIIEARAK